MKEEPIFMVNEKRNPCTRCRFIFKKGHLDSCKAKNEHCRSSGMTGYFARMCRIITSGNLRGKGRKTTPAGMRRVKLIGQADGQSETGSENDEDKMVSHVNGSGNQPIVMKGKKTKSHLPL